MWKYPFALVCLNMNYVEGYVVSMNSWSFLITGTSALEITANNAAGSKENWAGSFYSFRINLLLVVYSHLFEDYHTSEGHITKL